MNDQFMKVPFPDGMDGTRIFGRIAAGLQNVVLMRTGWLPLPAVLISTTFIVGSLALWWLTILKMGHSKRFACISLLLIGFSEPVISAAEKTRYEFLGFFLFSLASYLAVRKMNVLALCVVLMSIETQPVAILCAVFVVALILNGERPTKALVLTIGSSVLLFLVVYWLLHPNAIHYILEGLSKKNHNYILGGTLRAYLVSRPRHLVEAVMGIASCSLWVRFGKTITGRPILGPLTCLFIGLGLMPHPNVSYMIYLIPPAVVFIVAGFSCVPKYSVLPACLLVVNLIEFVYLYHVNQSEGFSNRDIELVALEIRKSEGLCRLSDEKVKIVGDYSLWYAHPLNYSGRLDLDWGDLYVCFKAPIHVPGSEVGAWSADSVERRRKVKVIDRFLVRGHEVEILTDRQVF